MLREQDKKSQIRLDYKNLAELNKRRLQNPLNPSLVKFTNLLIKNALFEPHKLTLKP